MQSVEEFLAYAVKIEEEAAIRFGELADAMQSSGNTEVGKLFRRLSDYSRMHLADARARSAYRDIPDLRPSEFNWPDFESPESAAIWAADPFIGRGDALDISRDAEKASLDYYTSVYETTNDPEIKVLAKEFVEEETSHVREIEKWIAAHNARQALPLDQDF
jgi:rubrerythrin